jgi:hypothetical protein
VDILAEREKREKKERHFLLLLAGLLLIEKDLSLVTLEEGKSQLFEWTIRSRSRGQYLKKPYVE